MPRHSVSVRYLHRAHRRLAVSRQLAVSIGAVLLGLCSCSSQPAVVPDVFQALSEGRSLDGREGLELYAPEARAAALEQVERGARYWAPGSEATAELEELLASQDATTESGRIALYAALSSFLEQHLVFTESEVLPGLRGLKVEGDEATAYRMGHNPGGEFREDLRFVRIEGLWYLAAPPGE